MDDRERPLGIDLFAGAGGLSLGFERAGFDIAAAVDFDPIHCATHAYNFPYTKTLCANISDVDGNYLRDISKIGNADMAVVFGGAPCQGFSLIGKRALDDSRNALVYHFVRLLDELRPQYFVFENVRGLTVGKQRKFLGELIEAFDSIGYNVKLPYAVLNACHYGVPQDRRRLFLIGARSDCRVPDYPARQSDIPTVRDAIGDLPEADRFPQLLECDWVRATFGTPSSYGRKLRGLDEDAENYGYPRIHDADLLTSSLRTQHIERSRQRFAATEHGKTEPVSRFFKLHPNGVSNTLRAGTASDRGAFTSPRPIHPETPRCITNREAGRLHSYPDWFRFNATKWHGFRQIGNSVPPFLGQAVAGQICEALGFVPFKPVKALELGSEELLELSMGEAADRFGVSPDIVGRRTRGAIPETANG